MNVPPLAWSMLKRWRAGTPIETLMRENDLTADKVRELIMQALRSTRQGGNVQIPKRVGELNTSDSRKERP